MHLGYHREGKVVYFWQWVTLAKPIGRGASSKVGRIINYPKLGFEKITEMCRKLRGKEIYFTFICKGDNFKMIKCLTFNLFKLN